MKTPEQLYAAQLRATMRSHALRLREILHPQTAKQPFAETMESAATYLGMALCYRNMAIAWESKLKTP